MKPDITGLVHLCRMFGLAQGDLPPIADAVATTAPLTPAEQADCATWKVSTGLYAECKKRVHLTDAERDVALRIGGVSIDALHATKTLRLARQVDALERARARASRGTRW